MSNLCTQCKRIPDSLDVETMHTTDRLPKEVDKLEVIGGMGSDYALGQVRVCLACKTHYLYFRNHDSESGVGYGYTDESIKRISKDRAKEAIEKNIKVLDDIVGRLQDEIAGAELHQFDRALDIAEGGDDKYRRMVV